MAAAIAFMRASMTAGAAEAIVPQPAFEISEFDTVVAGGRLVRVAPRRRTSPFRWPRCYAAITPRTRDGVPDQPEQPDGRRRCRSRTSQAIARALPPGGIVFVDEAYADFARRRPSSRELASVPNVVVGRTFAKAYGLAGLRLGALVGEPATLDSIRPAMPFTASTSRPWWPSRRRSRIRVHAGLPAAGRGIEGARLRGMRPARLITGGATRTSCWSASASAPRVVAGAARAGHLPPRQVERTGMRRLHPHHDRHRGAYAQGPCGPRGGPMRRALIDRRTTETRSSCRWLEARAATTSDRHPVPRPHARALRPARRLRPDASRRTAISTSISTTPSRTRASRSAKRSRRRSATQARHQSRRLFRDADGRDARGRGDRSRRAAACGGRSEGAAARVGDLQTELVHDFFEGFASGARANVHVKVMYGRSSHQKIEAVFKAFARALRVACARDRRLARMLPSTKGLL